MTNLFDVIKHLPGKHNQKLHAGSRGGKSAAAGSASRSKDENAVLDFFAEDIKNMDSSSVADTLASVGRQDLLLDVKDDNEWERLNKRNGADWEKAFSERFGMSSAAYAKKLASEDVASLSDQQKKISNMIGNQVLTIGESGPKVMAKQGVKAKASKSKAKPGVHIESRYEMGGFVPAATIQKKFGMDVAGFMSELGKMGIKVSK